MLGIDTGKFKLHCTLRDPQTGVIRWNKEIPNTEAAISQILTEIPSDISIVIEPTGRYSNLTVELAKSSGRTVLIAPTLNAKHYLSSLQSRAKNDKIDSKGLSEYGRTQTLRHYPIKDKALDTIDQFLSARKGISAACSRFKLMASELPEANQILQVSLSSLKAELKNLDKLIAGKAAAEPKLAIMKEFVKVPGIGPVTATAVASRLAGKCFDHPDQFVAYIGLDIRIRQSGKRKGNLGLTCQGDAELRRLLFCCAQSSLRVKDSPFKAQYDREVKKGLPTTAALCAVSRKMAKLCWSLHHHNALYDVNRLYKSPNISKPKGSEELQSKSAAPAEPQPSDLIPKVRKIRPNRARYICVIR